MHHSIISRGSKISEPPLKYYDRCAIIPYYIYEGNINYIFSIDRYHVDTLGDFGGRSKIMETWYDTAIREYNEESYGMLSSIDKLDVYRSINIHHSSSVLSLVRIDPINVEIANIVMRNIYIDNMKNPSKKGYEWEKIGIKVINHNNLEILLRGEKVEGKKLWRELYLMLKNHHNKIKKYIESLSRL